MAPKRMQLNANKNGFLSDMYALEEKVWLGMHKNPPRQTGMAAKTAIYELGQQKKASSSGGTKVAIYEQQVTARGKPTHHRTARSSGHFLSDTKNCISKYPTLAQSSPQLGKSPRVPFGQQLNSVEKYGNFYVSSSRLPPPSGRDPTLPSNLVARKCDDFDSARIKNVLAPMSHPELVGVINHGIRGTQRKTAASVERDIM
jgi:hypothetical protein